MRYFRKLPALIIVMVAGVVSVPTSSSAEAADGGCGLPDAGQIEVADLPEGTDVVECAVVGREIDFGDVVLEVPPPGEGVALSGDVAASDESGEPPVTVDVLIGTDETGAVFYEADGATVPGSTSSSAATDGCDTDYLGAIKVWELTGTFSFWVDNEGQPGGSAYTPADTGAAVERAGQVWHDEKSPCYPEDHSTAPSLSYAGSTTYNGDFKIVDGTSVCDDRDHKSTIDTGNLDKAGTGTYVALNCTWYETDGAVWEVLESDIRFNTNDVDFTYHPHVDGCDSNDYDVDSLMTHETGHTYGLKDKTDSDQFYQTMFGSSEPCTSYKRNLGKSDVRHLRARYPE